MSPTSPSLPFQVVDVFAEHAFTGNPAAVVRLPGREWPAADWMQRVAAEFNLSQTAFLVELSAESFAIRWFSARQEVPLCGHASLASAHALLGWGCWRRGRELQLATLRRGTLLARADGSSIALTLPTTATTPCTPPERAARALGIEREPVAARRCPPFLVLELPSAADVLAARPKLEVLRHWHRYAVALTARSEDPTTDFVTRLFAPRVGIPEDPACGSVHAVLGPLWRARLGKNELVAEQGSRRGGRVGMRFAPDQPQDPSRAGGRMDLLGSTVTTMSGLLHAGASLARVPTPGPTPPR